MLLPAHVVLTTPNRDYNANYGLPDGTWRHSDHRFEWTRAEFAAWAEGVAARCGDLLAGAGERRIDADAVSDHTRQLRDAYALVPNRP